MPVRLPHDLTTLTAEQVEWCVAYHAAMAVRRIRRWQELVDEQIRMAWQQRNDFALNNLRVMEELLRRAAEGKLPPLEEAALKRPPKPCRAVLQRA
jgi:hypothetical protein